ncbi:hypothetical protein EV361DRAFT_756438, partial [Lentinula raphanica]
KDYALDRTGGTIVPALTSSTEQYSPSRITWLSHLFTRDRERHVPHRAVPPRSVIEEDVHIGHCWKFGPQGHIGIRLSEMILLTHFTVYFPDPQQLSAREIKEAPKHIRLWAAS